MKTALNAMAVLTLPVWWPTMVAVECLQLACGASLSKLLGPFVYEKLNPQ